MPSATPGFLPPGISRDWIPNCNLIVRLPNQPGALGSHTEALSTKALSTSAGLQIHSGILESFREDKARYLKISLKVVTFHNFITGQPVNYS